MACHMSAWASRWVPALPACSSCAGCGHTICLQLLLLLPAHVSNTSDLLLGLLAGVAGAAGQRPCDVAQGPWPPAAAAAGHTPGEQLPPAHSRPAAAVRCPSCTVFVAQRGGGWHCSWERRHHGRSRRCSAGELVGCLRLCKQTCKWGCCSPCIGSVCV